jgi:hypothetical protein
VTASTQGSASLGLVTAYSSTLAAVAAGGAAAAQAQALFLSHLQADLAALLFGSSTANSSLARIPLSSMALTTADNGVTYNATFVILPPQAAGWNSSNSSASHSANASSGFAVSGAAIPAALAIAYLYGNWSDLGSQLYQLQSTGAADFATPPRLVCLPAAYTFKAQLTPQLLLEWRVSSYALSMKVRAMLTS